MHFGALPYGRATAPEISTTLLPYHPAKSSSREGLSCLNTLYCSEFSILATSTGMTVRHFPPINYEAHGLDYQRREKWDKIGFQK